MLFSPIKQKITRTASTFELIMQELMDELPGKKRLLIGYVERIIDLLTKEYQIHIAQIDKKELHAAIVKSICEYIQNTLPTVSVNDISEKFNYNPDYLNRLFKKEMKMNLSNYIQESRVHRLMICLFQQTYQLKRSAIRQDIIILVFFIKNSNKYMVQHLIIYVKIL